MSVYLGSDKVGVTKELGTDRLQWKCDNMKSLYYEFRNYQGTEIPILKGLDTSKVTDMSYVFSGCSNLISLDISDFDTSNVTTMYSIFIDCRSLADLNISSFNTSKVTSMQNMFSSCEKITTLNLSNFDTENVTTMQDMFNNCSSLTSLNLSSFNTSKVTNMYSMFEGCSNLTSLDVSKFNTSNVTNMNYMFYNCINLINLDVSNFDMSKVTNMHSMFKKTKIKIIDFSSTDTGKVGSMTSAFEGCTELENLLNLNLISLTAYSNLFTSCSSLTNLTLYNIKKPISLSSSSNLTLDSLVHTIKQLWDLTGSTSQRLTLSTASKNLIANVYVKLVDITDDMIAQDENIIYKKPCVVCESTDEGAMTITEYATSKNWAIA